ncbi:kinase-like protein [Gymnopus androsaceus JB14]|uniref:Kinase-like protein n=1 Tax=Gymnopus androsaceus JB14 TaxID=1447944 RepID=A0A6A4GQR5_9AGAR|nr:kinase-like protein [Gymnopus androsaceus JB14]
MAELIGAITLPKVLSGTWNILKCAYDLYSSVEMRKTQIRILLDRCRYLVEKLAQHLSIESNEALSPALQRGVDDLQQTCQAVKDVLEKIEQKGFLWCVMNKGNIDGQILDVESRLTSTFEVLNQDMRLAHKQDHTELVAKLDKLSASDQRILDALQDHGGLQRRMEELLVAVHKCVKRLGSEQSPEAKFLRNAGTALQRMSQGHPQTISEDWIVTSLEVDFDTANVIGQGSFGRVFRGQWNAALVAIKQMYINDARALTERDRQAMYKEVEIWTTLHHPNILTLYGACLEAEMPFLVMQHCRFGNLCQYLRANPNVNRIDLAYGVVAGMTYLHSRDIVHADLKGANVLSVCAGGNALSAACTQIRTKLPKKEISQIFLQHLKDTPLYYLHEFPLPHCTQSSHGTGLRKWHLKNLGSPNVSFAELATPNGCPKAITHQHPRTPSDTFPAPFDDSSSIACFATCLR